ncbi:hypothetical protein [Paenibacillus dendritiformis]|uniref:hypothetical protein n=1 Tax=Paenibacillus dendritiformis TaxID=130049 RepID=UPI0018CEE06D|nr:hypothetical protein [Paenibacillus dendritiformis]
MIAMIHNSMFKTFLSLVLVFSMLTIVTVGLDEGIANGYDDVTIRMNDIHSLGEYVENHSSEFFTVNDNKIIEKLTGNLSLNEEAISFSGPDKKLSRENFKGAFFSGKIQERYNVYTVGFESVDIHGK